MTEFVYRKIEKIIDCRLISCFVYYVKPRGVEKKHFHRGIEVVYVIDGNCKTHRKGRIYFYKSGQTHEMINDSKRKLVIVCLTIPRETKENTTFV